jgi:hypothetical protein
MGTKKIPQKKNLKHIITLTQNQKKTLVKKNKAIRLEKFSLVEK